MHTSFKIKTRKLLQSDSPRSVVPVQITVNTVQEKTKNYNLAISNSLNNQRFPVCSIQRTLEKNLEGEIPWQNLCTWLLLPITRPLSQFPICLRTGI